MIDTDHRSILITSARGSGTLAIRWPAGVVVLDGSADDAAAAVRDLRPAEEPAPASGLLIERLRMLRLDHFAAAVSTPGGWRLMWKGEGSCAVGPDAADRPATAPHGDGGITEVDVAIDTTPIWVGIGAVGAQDRHTWINGQHLDLAHGVVPGRGIVLTAASVPPRDPRPSSRNFAVVDFDADQPLRRQPLEVVGQAPSALDPSIDDAATPVHREAQTEDTDPEDVRTDEVLGIQCSRGHFNNPTAAYCQVCGISMVHVTHHLVRGQRPTLGFLVFDDGATFALDRSYLIGREPSAAESDLAPLTADDTEHTVSRSHAELLLDGWDLTVADLGSTNGTFVWDNDRREWERVLPNQPRVVAPGSSVAVGRKTFVYEPVARSV